VRASLRLSSRWQISPRRGCGWRRNDGNGFRRLKLPSSSGMARTCACVCEGRQRRYRRQLRAFYGLVLPPLRLLHPSAVRCRHDSFCFHQGVPSLRLLVLLPYSIRIFTTQRRRCTPAARKCFSNLSRGNVLLYLFCAEDVRTQC